jgi:phage baseplate assembly protein W
MVRKVQSIEDGKLGSITKTVSRSIGYSDIDLAFVAKPNGELYKKIEAAAVKQAVKNIILTNYYEKPFLPFYGGNIRGLLFELLDPNVEDDVYNNIVDTLGRYEPRAKIIDIAVKARDYDNSLGVTITFKVLNSDQLITFSTYIDRLR